MPPPGIELGFQNNTSSPRTVQAAELLSVLTFLKRWGPGSVQNSVLYPYAKAYVITLLHAFTVLRQCENQGWSWEVAPPFRSSPVAFPASVGNMEFDLFDGHLERRPNFLEEAPEVLKTLAYQFAKESDETPFQDGGE